MAHVYDEAHVVVFEGDLDVYRAGEIRRTLYAVSAPRVIYDLSAVQTISAAVLSEFVQAYKERAGRGLKPARMVVTSAHVRRVFEITNLTKLWPFFESLDAAKGAVPA